MTQMKDIRGRSDQDLVEFVNKGRDAIRGERLKDKFSKNAATIRTNKKDVARALTELNSRRNAPSN